MQYILCPAYRSTSGTVNVVVAIECMFFIYFGCDIKVGTKQEITIKTRFFKPPFRSYVYKQHHYIQHPELWWDHQATDDAGKMELF